MGELLKEQCPDCNSDLIHFDLNGIEVYGCEECEKEVSFTDSIKVYKKKENKKEELKQVIKAGKKLLKMIRREHVDKSNYIN